jgi:phage tail sheath protein FI
LSDAVDRGITVTEIAAMDHEIDVSPETTAAFVGRALRGPLNIPVLVTSFGDFQRRFGGSWSRSSLGPSVRQFFEHGGAQLYVVRVANDARGALVCLPANGSALVLRAVDPGSTEIVRAAVDYDGIDADNDELFNLTLQRVNPGTGRVDDQEFYHKVSYREDAEQFVGDALLASDLARVVEPLPVHRPESTGEADRQSGSSYAEPVQAGTDGKELSDYDLIGSRRDKTGLFALEQVDDFDILYLPPPGKGVDTGPAAILAAEMYCRERRAMLVVDPRAEWSTAAEAARGVRELGYASPNMIGYYPRMRERAGDDIARPAGGAIAGLLCKQDRMSGPWSELDQPGLGLQRRLVPAVEIGDGELELLHRAGLNVVTAGTAGRCRVSGALTMGRGAEAHRGFMQLPVQRLCLRVISAVAAATRWAVFRSADRDLAERVRLQVLDYFECLAELGAFAGDRFTVSCEAGVAHEGGEASRGVTLLLVFQPAPCDAPLSLTLHLAASGCRVASTAFAPCGAMSA